MTWNQILRKLQPDSVVASLLSGDSIEDQISRSVGYRDEASCEILSQTNIPAYSAENAERTMRSMLSVSRDFSNLYVLRCEKKGEHKAIATLLSSHGGTVYIYTVEFTREN